MTIRNFISACDPVEWLTDSQADQIVQVLHQFADAVALALLVDTIKDCASLPELLHALEKLLPETIQPVFCEQTRWLQTRADEDAVFIQHIKQEFTVRVGPIAPLLVDTLLENNADFSQFDLIEALLGYLAPETDAKTIRQQLHNVARMSEKR